MPVTAGQILTTVSELRSKIAILKLLVVHLQTNYMRADDDDDERAPPEMYVEREDFARVPDEHIALGVSDLLSLIVGYQRELAEWEGTAMETKASREKREAQEAKLAAKTAKAKAQEVVEDIDDPPEDEEEPEDDDDDPEEDEDDEPPPPPPPPQKKPKKGQRHEAQDRS